MTPASSTLPPAACRQTRFLFRIADDVRLVSMETARAVASARGLTAEEVTELAEDHEAADYLPAFDVSLKARKMRELRFWSGALRQRDTASPFNLDSIIANCVLTNLAGLPNKNIHVNNSQLERAWCVSNDLLLDLIEAAEIVGVRVGRNWRVNRASAAEFLRRRAL